MRLLLEKISIKKIIVILFTIITIISLASCHKRDLRIVDYQGQQVHVPKAEIKKVAVLDFGFLDLLDVYNRQSELNLEIQTSSTQGKLPEHLKKYPQTLGSVKEPNYDNLAKFNPDVIFIGGRLKSQLFKIDKIAPVVPVYALDEYHYNYFNLYKENCDLIKNIFTKVTEEENNNIKNFFDPYIKDIQDKNKNNTLKTMVLNTDGKKLSQYGPKNDRFGLIYTEFLYKNMEQEIQDSTHGQEFSAELLGKLKPEIIFYFDRTEIGTGEASGLPELSKKLEELKVPAYINKRFYKLDTFAWYLASGGFYSTWQIIKDVKQGLPTNQQPTPQV